MLLDRAIVTAWLYASAALSHRQVIPAIALREMRPFHKSKWAAFEDVLDRSDKAFFGRRVLLEEDAVERAAATTVIPNHVQEPLSTVVVMKQRRVEAR